MMLATLLAVSVIAGAAPQDAPSEWRRTDMTDDTPGATAFSAETDGVRQVTVIIRTAAERGPERYRGVVMKTEVRCSARQWRILGTTYYGADYSVVKQDPAWPEAPLIRQTPLHSAITDVCDGGHTGPVGLTTPDPITALRWLAGE